MTPTPNTTPAAIAIPPNPTAVEPARAATARRAGLLGGIGAAALLVGVLIGARGEPPQTTPPPSAADGGAGQLQLTWLVRPRPAVQPSAVV